MGGRRNGRRETSEFDSRSVGGPQQNGGLPNVVRIVVGESGDFALGLVQL